MDMVYELYAGDVVHVYEVEDTGLISQSWAIMEVGSCENSTNAVTSLRGRY